jgi:tetratricopeptide (TPR) repeat protein
VIFRRASLLVKLGRSQEAIQSLEELKRRFPEDLKLHKTVADAYFDLGMFNKALESYQIILSKKPKSRLILIKVGDTYAELKRYKLAEESYKKAAALDTTDILSQLKLAAIYISSRRYRQANSILKRVITMNPEHSYANLLLGDLYKVYGEINRNSRKLKAAQSNWRTAINYYGKALKDPSFATYARNEIKRCKIYIEKVQDEIWWKKKEG